MALIKRSLVTLTQALETITHTMWHPDPPEFPALGGLSKHHVSSPRPLERPGT